MGFKRVIAAAIALALLVAALGVFLVFTQLGTLSQARAWVYHTRAVIETTQRVEASVQDAEQGERGFLLTQDAGYLEPYERAGKALPVDEGQLQTLVADNPAQI